MDMIYITIFHTVTMAFPSTHITFKFITHSVILHIPTFVGILILL